MKWNKTFKKITAIIMIFTILLGIQGKFSLITTKASYNPVKMYYCDNYYSARGAECSYVYIQIDAGSAANKSVIVHYSDSTGEWHDSNAGYFTKLDNNTEIWKATIAHSYGIKEYAIKYVGDGKTYWDNNDGNNYTRSNILGEANVKSVRLRFPSYSDKYQIVASVKNIAYEKVVKVRFTQDNWATYKDVDLKYDSPSTVNNLEWWTVTLDIDKNKMFEYCIYYEVNGQTYWDSNFGENYNDSFYSPL